MDVAQAALPAERWIEVKYDGMMARPEDTLRRVCDFLDVEPADEVVERISARVSPRKLEPLADVVALRGEAAYKTMFDAAEKW